MCTCLAHTWGSHGHFFPHTLGIDRQVGTHIGHQGALFGTRIGQPWALFTTHIGHRWALFGTRIGSHGHFFAIGHRFALGDTHIGLQFEARFGCLPVNKIYNFAISSFIILAFIIFAAGC